MLDLHVRSAREERVAFQARPGQDPCDRLPSNSTCSRSTSSRTSCRARSTTVCCRSRPLGGLMVKRVQNIPVMIDLDKRFEIMDRHEGYAQVLTLAAPPLENVARTRPFARTGQAGQRRDGQARRALPGPLPGLRRVAADEQSRRGDARNRPRHRRARRHRRADLHQCQRRAARPARVPAALRAHGRRSTCQSGCTRPAPPTSRTTSARSAPSTTCGGPSAGRTRPPWRWRACCFRVCSIVTRT